MGEYNKYVTHIHAGEEPALFVNVPPLPSQALVGRDAMLADLADRLIAGKSPALSTSGMPGVGKTALAVALAHHQRVLKHFDGGVLWAGLGREPDVVGIQASWATALGFDISDLVGLEQRQQAIRNAIGQRCVLIVIDDAWASSDVWASSDAWTPEPAEMLRCGGQAVHLLTTRDDTIARGFAGAEQNLHVPELEEDPSVELLRTLAPEAYAADRDAICQLAEAVGGLPLSLELLGGYLAKPERHLFPDLSQQALAELDDPRKRLSLAKTRLGELGKKETLAATIQLSLDPLAETRPDAAPAFYALGAFAPKPARFQRAAAEAVAETDAATLALLIARNLLEGEGNSLALHQTLADAATQHCPEAARQRHRDHYLALVNEDRGDWQRIERLYPQILHAWQRQINVEPEDKALFEFVWTLQTYQERRGLWQDKLSWAEKALNYSLTQGLDKEAASMFVHIGYIYNALGDKQKALDYYGQALPLFRQVGDRGGEASTLNNIGSVYDDLGEKQKALDYFEQALPLIRQVGDRAGTLNNIGGVYDALGEKQKALDYYEQALPLRRQVGDRRGEAGTLNNIGRVYDALGEKQKALDYYEQALPLFRQVGDRGGEATTLNNIGSVYDALGDKQKALDYFEQALPLFRQVGDRGGEATTLNNIGSVYDALGDKQKALEYYEQALPMHRQVGNRTMEATTLSNIGAVYDALGDKQKALEYFEQALPMHRQVGNRAMEATTLNNIGMVYSDLGEKQKALDYFEQALPLRRQVGDRGGEATTLNNIGGVYDALGEKQKALDTYEQALPLFRHVGDRGGEATTLNNIGGVYDALGDKQKALEYYKQAVDLLQSIGAVWYEAMGRANIGYLYMQQGRWAQAEAQLQRAVAIGEAVGHPNTAMYRQMLTQVQANM